MKKYIFPSILLVFISIHLFNLTLLPIFNDEAIYLSWGWISLHVPDKAYMSLLDAKQPLVIWLFGIFANIFPDPLWGGRLVSVLWGVGSVVGIYKLTKNLFDEKTAYLAMGLFAITPLFVFYNRQALMESALICVGIWSCYYLLKLIKDPTIQNSLMLGVMLGGGFAIKSSGLVFLLGAVITILLNGWKRREYRSAIFLVLFVFFAVNVFWILHPDFWNTWSTNSRYTYTMQELFTFPLVGWAKNIWGFFEILFFFLNPFISIFGFVGLYLLYKQKKQQYMVILTFGILVLLGELFSVRVNSSRYLVSFLFLFIILSSYVLMRLWAKNLYGKTVVAGSLLLSVASTGYLLASPVQWIQTMSSVTTYANEGYIKGWTSGIGVNETMHYLFTKTPGLKLVFTAPNTGNPENAIEAYSYKTKNMVVLPIQASFFPKLDTINCFTSEYPAYMVTRDMQMEGMGKYFELEKTFKNPYSDYAINVHTLRDNCQGKKVSLSTLYAPIISQLLQGRGIR